MQHNQPESFDRIVEMQPSPEHHEHSGNGAQPIHRQQGLSMHTEDGPSDPTEIAALIEALLLVAPTATSIDDLASGAGIPVPAVEAALAALEKRTLSGWVVQRHGETVQLATAPRFAGHVRRFLRLDRETRLSGAALETLAIVAYQQPVTKTEIESVRGVDCAGVLHTLLQRGLIEQVGRLTTPGNPIQYGTTPDFLLHFGLRSLAELPPLGQVQGQDVRGALEAAVASAELEPIDPRM
jgi:segregation and condensation protein B